MTPEQLAKVEADEAQEVARVAKLSDAEVLLATGHGRLGAGIVGKPLAERSARLLKASGDGVFGPAITDPDYAAKQAAKRAAEELPKSAERELEEEGDEDGDEEPAADAAPDDTEEEERIGEIDPMDLKDPRNPWTYVTLSGAKALAQKHSVSYKPKAQRLGLIADLQAAGVVPPALPDPKDLAE